MCGESFRSIAERLETSPATAYRKYKEVLSSLPHCADVTRKYCSKFCGILLVDGKYVRIKGHERKIPVIYGVDYLTHDIPSYTLSVSENYPTCYSFFTSLRLLNYPLQIVVSDDNYNIFEACRRVYPSSLSQICQNHYKELIRSDLDVRNDKTYQPFMYEIESLFNCRKAEGEFNHFALKIYRRYSQDAKCRDILLDIQRRSDQLLAYTKVPKTPKTTNLIESYNSHIEGRLKTIKGFESFSHANLWFNAYFIKRRLKRFTDCGKRFRHLNGKSSLQMTLTDNQDFDNILKLIR